MKPEEPSPDLEQLKRLLAKSYDGSEGEDIPPMPDGLRDRIEDQYGRSATSSAPAAEPAKAGFFATLSQLFAKPAMQAVAAAVVLLLVVTVVIRSGSQGTDGTVRGPGGTLSEVTCILHQLDDTEREAVAASGLDRGALTTTNSPAELENALQTEGARLVLDGEIGLILGYRPGDTAPSIEEPLPDDPAALTTTIAEIIGKLSK